MSLGKREAIRIDADEAKWLMASDAYTKFIAMVREEQIEAFTSSTASDTLAREEAHAILRALDQLDGKLQAAISAQTILNKKG